MATAESVLLKKIERDLTVISEAQHAQARQVAILRKARTLLHVGGSIIEVNAMLEEQLGKERVAGTSLGRIRSLRSQPARAQHA